MTYKNKPILFIRADGGEGIGMGHITRTSVLADALKGYMEIQYICLENYKQGIAYVEEKGYTVNKTSKENLLDIILSSDAKSIITDNYSIDDKYINEIRQKFKWVGYIDDNAEKSFKADFILNQNFGAETISYQVNKECSMLLGSQYILLRSDYKNASPLSNKKQVRHILLTVGGSDVFNFTQNILKNLCALNYIFHVVIGPVFPYENEIYQKYANYKQIIFHKNPNMCQLMKLCDIAISSCGSTLYELGSLGVPTLGIGVTDNQIPLAKRMGEAGLIVYLGDIRETLREPIDTTLTNLAKDYNKRKNMHQQMISTINKNGAEEVAKHIISLMKENGA